MSELVSIIIPTYNRFENLKHAINSVKEQSYPNKEIIVINDNSTESQYYTEKVDGVLFINLPINNRIKYNTNAAQGMTRNYGIKIAEGNYIAFLDDDDYFLPGKLEKQIPKAKEYGMCSSNMVTGRGLYNKNNSYDLYFKQKLPEIFTLDTISHINYINNSSVIIRKDIIEKTGLQRITQYEDYDYWKRALVHCSCYYFEEPLIYYDLGSIKNHN
jgi:glycosyltransferase involved in cell wall biosynthesis